MAISSRRQAFRIKNKDTGRINTVYRKNPNYLPGHCFTTRQCSKCGEWFEACCSLSHICSKQNSYPHD